MAWRISGKRLVHEDFGWQMGFDLERICRHYNGKKRTFMDSGKVCGDDIRDVAKYIRQNCPDDGILKWVLETTEELNPAVTEVFRKCWKKRLSESSDRA